MDPWTDAMRRGDFAKAWTISDAVLRQRRVTGLHRADQPRHLQAIWNGRPVDGRRVLVRCYHGLGDTLQFVRLLPLLRRRAREVVLWVQPELIDLLRSADGIDRIEALHDGDPRIERDIDVELMELPHVLRLESAQIPREIPYLRVARPARSRDDRLRRVGIVWRAGAWDVARSIPPSALAPLAAANVRWASLQYGERRLPLGALDFACRDLRAQAARMLALDLVISVDTMIAHLAGALGLPVWTLLPARCDWRWMTGRDDTPWYPTMRLFRQRRAGGWDDVVERVLDALRHWCSATPRDTPPERPPSWQSALHGAPVASRS